MQVTSRRACLRIAAFTTFPLAYEMIRAWVDRHGHELVVVITTPEPPKQSSVIYRDIVARAPREHGTTRWQIYDWRKRLRDGRLVLAERFATLPSFAALLV